MCERGDLAAGVDRPMPDPPRGALHYAARQAPKSRICSVPCATSIWLASREFDPTSGRSFTPASPQRSRREKDTPYRPRRSPCTNTPNAKASRSSRRRA